MKMKPVLSRREVVGRLSAGMLLALGHWPGSLRVAAAGGGGHATFRFAVVNDLHCASSECGPWLERAGRAIRAQNPEFCLVAGDLSDRGDREHLAVVRETLKTIGVDSWVQIGNHDFATPKDRSAYEQVFPHRLNYAFRHRGWQFVALDSTEGQSASNTRIQPETLQWIQDHRKTWKRNAPVVILTHFPLGPGVTNRPLNADDLLDQFREHHLAAVYSGHFHSFTERQRGETVFTTNKCCSLVRGNHDNTPEKGIFICQTPGEGLIHREFIEIKSA